MTAMTSREAARQPFLPLVRALAETWQVFSTLDGRLLREHGLTIAQADVLFTLGNTSGMTLGELGARTLITKGTLTGVVDRLEARGFVSRRPSARDGRCIVAELTDSGAERFERVFPAHIANLGEHFARLTPREIREAMRALETVRAALPE